MTAKLKIHDAAYVVETTPLSIRKWLEKSQIGWLANVRSEKGAVAEFNDLDLLRMRLLVVLVDFGATVREAAELVNMVWMLLPPDPTDPNDPNGEDRTVAAILAIIRDEFDQLVFTRQGSMWSMSMTKNRPTDKTPPAALIIKPGDLFREVLERAKALQERRAWAA